MYLFCCLFFCITLFSFFFSFRFSLGPLELRVVKTVNGETKTAKAVTDTMLGLMDMRIRSGQADITEVYFDEPGGVSVSGNLRRAQFKKSQTYDDDRPYRYSIILINVAFAIVIF